jgi:small subunit ribosomal protein S3e
MGPNGVRLRELTSLIQKRFNYPPDTVELFVKRIEARGLSAAIQAESLKYKLLNQFPVRMAANGVVFFSMKNGAKGVEVTVSGKLRAQRAKAMKFKDGYMVHSGEPKLDFIDTAYRHVQLKQGVLGVKVKIMLPHDPTGTEGTKKKMPDHWEVFPPRTRG